MTRNSVDTKLRGTVVMVGTVLAVRGMALATFPSRLLRVAWTFTGGPRERSSVTYRDPPAWFATGVRVGSGLLALAGLGLLGVGLLNGSFR